MTSVGNAADLILSADDQIALIKEKVDRILRESVDISSFTLSDPRLLSDLKVHSCFFQLTFNSESDDADDDYPKAPVAIRRRWTTGCCPK